MKYLYYIYILSEKIISVRQQQRNYWFTLLMRCCWHKVIIIFGFLKRKGLLCKKNVRAMATKNFKRLPYGYPDFESIRTENYAYVDKTRFIDFFAVFDRQN